MTEREAQIEKRKWADKGWTVFLTKEPDFDDICAMVHIDERCVFINRSARRGVNVVQLMPRRRTA